jgi:hypothetical protein
MDELKEAMQVLERLSERIISDYLRADIARVRCQLIDLQETITLLRESGYQP